MTVTDRQPDPWEGPTGRRRQRIHRELRYLGETARWWADACRLIEDETLESGAHMALHALRELNGTLLDLFVPIANIAEDPQLESERERLAQVLADAGFSKDVISGAQSRLALGARPKIAAVCRLLSLDAGIEKAWKDLKLHTAHRRNLGMRAITDVPVIAAFDAAERVFGAVAERWTERYPDWFALVDDIVAGGPETDNAKRLVESVPPIYELLHRFFDSIKDPAWLGPLQSHGLLTRVPAPEMSDDETTVRYLPWPAAVFLARVAEAKPAEVRDVLLEVAGSENPLALYAVIAVAAQMPVELAASLVTTIGDGVVRWRGVRRDQRLIASLLDRLLGGAGRDDALALADAVLALDGPHHVGGDQPQEYRRLVGEVTQALSGVDRHEVLDMLVGILRRASGTERSVVWLRRVDDPIRLQDDSRTVLAKATLEFAGRLVADGDATVLQELMASGVPAVQRIAIHLARLDSAIDPSVVLDDMVALKSEDLRVELGELVRDRWHDLGDGQGRYLQFIAGGPPEATLDRADDAERLRRTWAGFYLQPVLGQLDRSDPTLVALLEGADVPEHDVLARFEVRARVAEHASPWSSEEMLALDPDDLVGRIKAFEPTGEVGMPSWRGIGETLTRVVAGDVTRGRLLLGAVADLPPEALGGVIAGVALVARRNPVDWDLIVDAALAGSRWSGMSGTGWDHFENPHTALCQQSLASIQARLRHDEPLPDRVFGPLIEVVATCLDGERTREVDPRYKVGPVGDLPPTIGNQAIDLLVDLMSAVARSGDVGPAGTVLSEALETELNPYVFAQAARRVHQLAADAPDWLSEHVNLVFGPPGSNDPRHRVAWQVMSYSEPEGIVGELLAPHYIAWVDALTGAALDEPGRNTAGHIGILAVAGLLPAGTVQRFFETAPVEGRAVALASASPTTAEQLEGAMHLWEARAASVDAGNDPDELGAINAWLRSDVLPPTWRLEQTQRAVRLGAPLGRPDVFVTNLAQLCVAAPGVEEIALDLLDRVLAQGELHQLAWSAPTVTGIIDRIFEVRPDLSERVAGARATAALRLRDPALLPGTE